MVKPNPHSPDVDPISAAWASVVPIRDQQGLIIGTGVAVAPGAVLTALHVVDPERRVTVHDHPVAEVVAVPLRRFGGARALAEASYHRSCELGDDLGTVDLALLVAPNLPTAPLEVREVPLRAGERIAVGGYSAGRWATTLGPISMHDDADLLVHVALGPGASGAPALDPAGHLTGIVTMDHTTTGTILVGPTLITAFLHSALRPIHHLLPDAGRV